MRRLAKSTFVLVGALSLVVAAAIPSPAKDAVCAEAKKTEKVLNSFGDLDPTDPNGVKLFDAAAKELKRLEGKAPSKIKADLKTAASAFETLGAAFKKVDFKKLAKSKNPKEAEAALKAIEKATSALDNDKVDAAFDRLEKYFEKECGIKS